MEPEGSDGYVSLVVATAEDQQVMCRWVGWHDSWSCGASPEDERHRAVERDTSSRTGTTTPQYVGDPCATVLKGMGCA